MSEAVKETTSAAFRAVLTPDDATQALADSHHHVVVVYKHSPICDLSAGALDEMNLFRAQAPSDLDLRLVDVLSARPASQLFEARTGVRHESPQVLVIKNGIVTWNASHRRITAGAVAAALT